MTKITIAYLGPKGTYTETIAKQLFAEAHLIPIIPIRKVIFAVENSEVDKAIVPLENFFNGEVREVLDTLQECSKTKIEKEVSNKIIHCLGALKNHREIKEVMSKDQALEQCSVYLANKYPNIKLIQTPSTAEAITIIKEKGLINHAAIASEKTLLENDFEIIAKDLCPNNKTRFVILSKDKTSTTKDDKTLLSVHPEIKDKPGVLKGILDIISEENINLEYIQSRPDGKNGYYFYLELEGHQKEKKINGAIIKLKNLLDPENKYQEVIKVLGSYPNSHWKEI